MLVLKPDLANRRAEHGPDSPPTRVRSEAAKPDLSQSGQEWPGTSLPSPSASQPQLRCWCSSRTWRIGGRSTTPTHRPARAASPPTRVRSPRAAQPCDLGAQRGLAAAQPEAQPVECLLLELADALAGQAEAAADLVEGQGLPAGHAE